MTDNIVYPQEKRIRQFVYTMPFLIIGIAFAFLINLHWFALAPSIACILIGSYNWISLEEGK